MKDIRHLLRDRALLALLALAVVLRSMIAPGFMLDTSPESPLGIAITFCEGFDRISINSAPTGEHAHHPAHATHTGHDVPAGDTGHAGKDHSMPSASCAALSVSSAYIEIVHDVTAFLTPDTADVFRADAVSPVIRNSYNQSQQPRAPPFSLPV